MKKLLLFILILFSLINSASADTINDNFNDCDITDWTLTGNTGFTTPSGIHAGQNNCYAQSALVGAGKNAQMSKTFSGVTSNSYWNWSFSVNQVAGADTTYFFFDTNGVGNGNYCWVFATGTAIDCNGAYAAQTLTNGLWYSINITKSGTNAVIVLKNDQGATMNVQTIAFTAVTNPNQFNFSTPTTGNTVTMRIDDVIVQSVSSTTTTFINFDQDTYGLGSRATISYGISPSAWDTFLSYSVGIYRAGTEVKRFSGIPQTSNLYYTFPDTGTYQARLQSCVLCVFGYDTIAQDSASVAQFEAYLFINETIPANRPFTVNYDAGYTVTDGAITAKLLNLDGTYTTDTIYYFSNSQSGSFSQTVHNVGQYLFELTDLSKGKVLTSVLSTSYYVPNIPTTNVSASYVNVTKDSFYKGEFVTGSYAIDNTNFSSYDTFTLDFYSVLRGISYSSQQVTEQVGDFNLYVPLAIEGQNKINLTGRNSTTNASLAEVSLNFSTINPFGYGISVTPTRVTPGQAFIVRAICPSPCRIEIVNQETDKTLLNKTYNSTTSFSYKINTIGFYAVILSDSSGNVQGMANVDVVTAANVSLTPSVGAPPGTIDVNTVNSMFSIFGIVAFWGFIIWIGVIFTSMGIMSRSAGGVNGTAMIAVAWISAVIIALIGLFAPYTIYVIVVSTIICAILFRLGRSSTVED